jgi:ABC-type Mn2+/Zn2+ transport system ATPase subunit
VTLLRLRGVSAGYGGGPVLRDVDLEVRASGFTGVVGPSGSGKTTLLRLLLGTLEPVGGAVERAPGLRVGYVPQLQSVSWDFPVTVAECVLMARRPEHPWPWPTPAERADVAAALDRLGIGALAGRHIRELSGGQQQRMFLARALVRRPQLLLLDEPTSGVDVQTRHEVLHLLAGLAAEGVSVLLTTHDLNGMAAHLPHLVALNGRVVATGPPDEVIRPAVLEEVYGARLDVLRHLGIPVVVERSPEHREVVL